MTTLNTKKVDESYKYDPFEEYEHPQEVQQPAITLVTNVQIVEGKKQLLKNIDNMFDGADFMFEIANRIFKRLGGK